ncbi:MAG: endonuclease Q family protein [Candidatus Cloacimonadaceae bacterium]
MAIAVDLHSHSSYAGGAGNISLTSLAETMRYKGIQVFGIGDCLYPPWQKEFRSLLTPTSGNLYQLKGTGAHFIRQTELIFTAALEGYRNRIIAHHIILYPDDESITKTIDWMQKKGYKNTIARPFITCRNQAELEDNLHSIQAINPLIEIIPAHVLTPDGILGSKNNLRTWKEFYGSFTDHIHAVETGLSADPEMLCRIPDLQNRTFISNSDCHSSALNRVGREFTILATDELSYEAIIAAIRSNKVFLTAEFLPSEGRYYLTGHRADRHPDRTPIFFTDKEPEHYCCPLCGKKMLQGVKSRAEQLTDKSLKTQPPKFMHLLPLIEVIAFALGTRNVSSSKVISQFRKCLAVFDTEISLWTATEKNIQELLDNNLPQEIINHILAVRRGSFIFDPPGYDGCYGNLKIQMEN